ncbi:MAG: peptide deformylase [Dehalococcoidia bacterium SM23_28_1]|nr:MAG: peptide deformylase [Dehalococcoidia bacterium SM23_28_1]
MAVLPITVLGDAVLRQKAKRVPQVDGSIRRLVEDMIDTMRDVDGVGLAAPQVGVPLRVVVIGIPGEEVIALINPEIVKRSGERRLTEGCLSVPGYWAEVTRSVSVTAKGQDLQGRPVRIKAKDDLLAQALEHETDHVNGVLYIDHLESLDELRKTVPESEEEGSAEL